MGEPSRFLLRVARYSPIFPNSYFCLGWYFRGGGRPPDRLRTSPPHGDVHARLERLDKVRWGSRLGHGRDVVGSLVNDVGRREDCGCQQWTRPLRVHRSSGFLNPYRLGFSPTRTRILNPYPKFLKAGHATIRRGRGLSLRHYGGCIRLRLRLPSLNVLYLGCQCCLGGVSR